MKASMISYKMFSWEVRHSLLQRGSSVSISEQLKVFRKFLKLTRFANSRPQTSSEEAEKHSDQMRWLEGQVRDQPRH